MLRAAASRWKDLKDQVIAKMKGQPRSPRSATSALLALATAALAAGIFVAGSAVDDITLKALQPLAKATLAGHSGAKEHSPRLLMREPKNYAHTSV